jgi:arsenate reductase
MGAGLAWPTAPLVRARRLVLALARKALAELLGTGLLVTAVVGSGIAATRLSPGQTGLQLLENSLVTGAALIALILALGPVSAAFNPLVTLAELVLGALNALEAVVFIGVQFVGALIGVVIAQLMYDLPAVDFSAHDRMSGSAFLSEAVATFGLLVVVFGVVRAGRRQAVAIAVGGYITAAYWFTSSTSFANPAVTFGRMFTDSFAGIAPGSVAPFIGAQVVGAALAVLVVRILYPQAAELAADLGDTDG